MSLGPRYCERCGRECSGTMFHDCEKAAAEERKEAELMKKVEDATPKFTTKELEILAKHEDEGIAGQAREALDRQAEVLLELAAFYKAKAIPL